MNAIHPAQNITTDTFHGTLRREQGAVQLLAAVTVPGEPVPKSRARYNGQGPKIRAYTPTSTLEAEQVIKWHYRKAVGPSQPEGRSGFGLACVFYVGKRQRRDVDNMIKLVADALTGLAWVDDSQMTEVSGRMVHGSSEPHLVFEVYYTDDLPDHARKQCGHCGKYFRTHASWEKKKTCSRACGTAALFDSRQRTCIGCGGQFTIKGSSEADRKYCSKACVHTHKTLQAKASSGDQGSRT